MLIYYVAVEIFNIEPVYCFFLIDALKMIRIVCLKEIYKQIHCIQIVKKKISTCFDKSHEHFKRDIIFFFIFISLK